MSKSCKAMAIERANLNIEIRAVEIKTDSKIYVARTEITGVNTKILRALSCKIPSAIIQEINL